MKKEKMNKKKKRLLIALFMLVISAVALTSASYAWFSANRVVTTTGIDVKVTAATGISISANALDFGKTIDMDDVIAFAKDEDDSLDSTLQLPEMLNPVSTAGIKGANTEFGFFRGELGESEDVVIFQESRANRTFVGADKNYTGGDYMAFDIYIKASQDLNLKLASTTAISAADTTAGTGNLETGLRIGFLPLGVSTDTSIANQQSAAYQLATVQSDWKIWNPVPDTHHAGTIDGYTSGSEETNGYYGATDVTTSLAALNGAGTEATQEQIEANQNHYVKYLYKDIEKESIPSYLKLLDSTNSNYVQGQNYSNTIFSVKAGINKVRVYVWLEGNDVDCVDAISISNGLSLALGFEVTD